MRKFYFLTLALLASVTLSAQLTYTVSNGVYNLTYGKTGDWSFYDPQSNPTFYVHVWSSKTDGDNNQGDYNDDWNNSNVTMTWDSTENAYLGTINLNSKLFTGSNSTMPSGTVVQRIGVVFKNQQQGAAWQSTDRDLEGPTTLTTLAVSETNANTKSQVAAGKLFTSAKGNLDLTVYDFGGKVIKTLKINANGNPIELNLSQKGLYLVKISGNNVSEVVKFAY